MASVLVISCGAEGLDMLWFFPVIQSYCFSIAAFELHSMLYSSPTNHFKIKKDNNHVDNSLPLYNM